MDKEFTIFDIIQNEKLIVNQLKFELDNHLFHCEQCTKDAITYHQTIINYLNELVEIKA